jgi:ankyrin repeat protein
MKDAQKKLWDEVVAGNVEQAEMIIKYGEYVDVNYNNLADEWGFLVQQAAGNNDPDMIAMLLRYEANIDAINKQGQTALHLAGILGHDAAARYLVIRGADFAIRDINEQTVLEAAQDLGGFDLHRIIPDFTNLGARVDIDFLGSSSDSSFLFTGHK